MKFQSGAKQQAAQIFSIQQREILQSLLLCAVLQFHSTALDRAGIQGSTPGMSPHMQGYTEAQAAA